MPYTKREAPNCDWCPYKKNCFYDLIGTKESKRAWREMRLANRFKQGEVVFHEGEAPRGLYVVCTGKVKVYKSSRTGQQLITRIEYPGDLVGHITLLAEGSYTGTAEALEPSVVSMIYERIGTSYNKLGVSNGAIKALRYAVQEMPFNAAAHYQMALAYSVSGHFNESLHSLGEALKSAPSQGELKKYMLLAKTDSELDPLRDMPGYSNLMSPYAEKLQARR